MVARTWSEGPFSRRNDKIASALVLVFALAPVAVPSLVLLAESVAPRATEAAPFQPPPIEASSAHAVAMRRAKFVARVSPSAAWASLASTSIWPSIPGGALIRSDDLTLSKPPAPPARPTLVAQTPRLDPSAKNGGWIMQNFVSVEVLDGLRLSAGSFVIALAGITPPAAGASCRRLDGVVESCLARADSRLAVLVQNRPVSCETFQDPQTGETLGRCKAGNIDLAADLLRNGLGSPG